MLASVCCCSPHATSPGHTSQALGQEERARFEATAARDKTRYNRQLKEFKQTGRFTTLDEDTLVLQSPGKAKNKHKRWVKGTNAACGWRWDGANTHEHTYHAV